MSAVEPPEARAQTAESAEPSQTPGLGEKPPTAKEFTANRIKSIYRAIDGAKNSEKVRAVLAITLVGVLVALQFAPSGDTTLTTAAETLAIAVVAFYFGLHNSAAPGPGRDDRSGAAKEPPLEGEPPDLTPTMLSYLALLMAASGLHRRPEEPAG